MLLRRLRRRISRVAETALWLARKTKLRLGHRLLEPDLRRLGGNPPAAQSHGVHQSDATIGLGALQFRLMGCLLRGAKGDPPQTNPEYPRDNELHGLPQTCRLLGFRRT